ncbi:TcpQ domain-containing protein [Cupriavidus necator]
MKYDDCRKRGRGGIELKNGMQRRSTLRMGAMIATAVAASSAFGFIDERQAVPRSPDAPSGAVAATSIAMVVPGAARRGPDALQGDFSGAEWYAPYPGPYGPMPLADSLIAQLVPILGPIRLEGESGLLQTPVVIPQGVARSAALRTVAERAGVVVRVKGSVVSIEPMRVSPMALAEQLGPARQLSSSPLAPPVYQDPAALLPVARPAGSPAPQPSFNPAPIERWVSQSDKGMTLKQVLKEWVDRTGQWMLRWNASTDYPAPDMEWSGDFLDAVDRTMTPYMRVKRPIEMVLHKEQGILEVVDKRN